MKRFALLVGLCAALMIGSAVAEPGYPSRPVRIVLGYGPGGVADIATRVLAQKLSERLGQQFIVDNRPGAGGTAAANEIAKVTPNGYTLYLAGNGATISHSLFKTLPFDIRDAKPISLLVAFDILLVIRKDSPLKSVRDVIAAARAKPGGLNIGTIAIGSTQNLSAELFKTAADISAAVVPYRTSPELIASLLRGDVDVGFEIYAGIKGPMDSGEAVAIATANGMRSQALPNVPTITEGGVAGFDVTSWNAIYGPIGMPDDIVAFLNPVIREVMASPDVRAKLLPMGIEPRTSTPEELGRRVRSEVAKWAAVIEKAGIEKQ